jgi:hypothetical protein
MATKVNITEPITSSFEGSVQAILIDPNKGSFCGASDPHLDGFDCP